MSQQWSFVAEAHANDNTGPTAPVVSVPTGTQNGDLMFLVASRYAGTSITTPAGWNLIDARGNYAWTGLYWRIASSEPSTYTITTAGDNGTPYSQAVILTYRGAKRFDAFSYLVDSNNPIIGLTVTAAVDDELALMVVVGNISGGGSMWEPGSGLTERLDYNGSVGMFVGDKNVAAGATGSFSITGTAFDSCQVYQLVFRPVVPLEGAIQGVGTLSGALGQTHAIAGALQGAGSVSGALGQKFAIAGAIEGVGVVEGVLEGTLSPDFTVFDLYLDDAITAQGLILHEDKDLKSVNQPIPTQAPKFDVGTNAFEQRPDFGFYFAQGDFSHGAGQTYFHKPSRDELMYFASEGFDISEPGKLTHLHAVLEDEDTTGAGALTQAVSRAFFADGTNVRFGDGYVPSAAYSTEDPSAAEAAVNVDNLCARGDEVFAAIGSGGLHIRSGAGVWTHWQPDGATDLSIGTVTKVVYLKNRIIAVGQAGRDIYEVITSSTPTSMLTLPAGWLFESIFEAGAYIYASAASVNAGLSRIYRFGLNSAGTAMEVKGSDPLPRNELAYAGIGYVGVILIGGGRWNASGGYDPFLYRAIQDDDGSLQLIKIAQAEGSGSANLSVLCFEPIGEQVLFGWSLGAASPTGVRTGLGSYHIGRGAFSHHLAKAGASTPARIYSIMYYKGVVLFTILGDGLYYEDTAHFVAEATLTSSAGDWNNAGLKVWDLIELAHDALPAGAVVAIGYATTLPGGATFLESLRSTIAGSKGTSGKITNISSRVFSVQIVSDAPSAATSAPEIQSFSIRSNPTRLKPEFELSRFIRIVRAQRKDRGGEMRYEDPLALKGWLEDLMDSWVTLYEPGTTWRAFVKAVTPVKPEQPLYKETLGRSQDEVFIIRLDMIATKES